MLQMNLSYTLIQGMRVIDKIMFIAICTFFFSCADDKAGIKGDPVLKEKYFTMEENGWKSFSYTQDIDQINYTATQVPLEYYILKTEGIGNLNKADSISKANTKERIVEFEFLHEEEQDLLKSGIAGLNYENAIQYLSYDIKNDFCLVTKSQDTIKSNGVIFERTFGVTPVNRLLIFFSNVQSNQSVQLIYDDKLFGKGVLKFNFKEKITKIAL